VQFDWSVKACVKAGHCGCVKGLPSLSDIQSDA
jgi:hypothetical protein